MQREFGIIKTIAVASLLASITGCSFKVRAMPGMDLSQPLLVAPLEREDYEVLDKVEGSACREMILFFSWGDSATATVPFSRAHGIVAGAALYNALDSAWANGDVAASPDAVISPIWQSSFKGFPPFYSKSCVTVRARGVRVK